MNILLRVFLRVMMIVWEWIQHTYMLILRRRSLLSFRLSISLDCRAVGKIVQLNADFLASSSSNLSFSWMRRMLRMWGICFGVNMLWLSKGLGIRFCPWRYLLTHLGWLRTDCVVIIWILWVNIGSLFLRDKRSTSMKSLLIRVLSLSYSAHWCWWWRCVSPLCNHLFVFLIL